MTICLVCHSIIKGQQYGKDCCRACAAFFRRTIQLKLNFSCQFDNDCNVTDKNRWSCRSCRLKRCYAVGMAKFDKNRASISPTEKAANEENNTNSSSIEFETVPAYTVDEIKFKVFSIISGPSCLEFAHNMPLSLCQEAMLAYETHTKKWPNCTKEKMRYNEELDMNYQANLSIEEIEYIAIFCMSLTPFVSLPIDQKEVLFKNFWMRFCEIDRTHVACQLMGYDRNSFVYLMYDGLAVDNKRPNIPKIQDYLKQSRESVGKIIGKNRELIKKFFVDPFKSFRPDPFEIIYFIMLDLWTVKEYDGITNETIQIAEAILKSINDELHDYYMYQKNMPNYASRLYKINYLCLALNKCVGLRKEEGFISRMFGILKNDFFLSEFHNKI